jgi:hypothetical protein
MSSAYVIVCIEVPVYMEFAYRIPILANEVPRNSRICERSCAIGLVVELRDPDRPVTIGPWSTLTVFGGE